MRKYTKNFYGKNIRKMGKADTKGAAAANAYIKQPPGGLKGRLRNPGDNP